MDAQETQRTAELDMFRTEKIGTRRQRLFQTETIWLVLKFFACQDVVTPRCCFLFRYDFEEAPAPIQRPRDGDGAVVASTRPNSMQESLPRMRTFWPRFRSWRPARCPAKLQGLGIPVVKLRQDPLAQPSQKTVKRESNSTICSHSRVCAAILGSMFFPAAALLTSEQR